MKRTFTILLAIWAVTASAQTFEWSPQSSGVTSSLNDVFFADELNGWAVGDNGIIINTTNGGQLWSSQTSGTVQRLRAVFFHDADTGWVAGGFDGTSLLKTVDGGLNWEDISPDYIYNGQMQILDIAFADANTGWMITWDSIYMSEDGGASWGVEDYLSGVSQLSHKALAVTSDSTAYVAGQNKRTTPFNSYADVLNKRPYDAPEAWGGSVASSFQTDDRLRSIAFSNATNGFAGGEKGVLYRLVPADPNNLSGPWSVNLDLSSAGVNFIQSISFASENTGMFAASTDVSGSSYTLIYYTEDSGDTWSEVPDSIQGLLSATVHAPDSTNAWIVGVGGEIYKGVPYTPPVGIGEEGFALDINIYPNPTSDFIQVEVNSGSYEAITYSLTDVSGKLVKTAQWHSTSSDSRFTIDISAFRNGVYLLNLSTDEGQSTFRVLKN